MASSPAQTLRWKSVPAGASGRSKLVLRAAEESARWWRAEGDGCSAGSPGGPNASGPGACRWASMYRAQIAPSRVTIVSGPIGLSATPWGRPADRGSGPDLRARPVSAVPVVMVLVVIGLVVTVLVVIGLVMTGLLTSRG